jgi:hypothetical protein
VVMELVDGCSLYEKVKENVVEKQLLMWFQQTVKRFGLFTSFKKHFA